MTVGRLQHRPALRMASTSGCFPSGTDYRWGSFDFSGQSLPTAAKVYYMARSRFAGVGWMPIVLALAGCGPGGPEIAHVAGRVTMDGKPLSNAAVVFVPETGRPA